MTCISFSQIFMKLRVYLSRLIARRNKNMLLDLVKIYKEQRFQLKGKRESYHLMFKISKISLPTFLHQFNLLPKNWCPPFLHVSLSHPLSISDHIKKKVSEVVFRKILQKRSPDACSFRSIIVTYLKKLFSMKSLNTRQCQA